MARAGSTKQEILDFLRRHGPASADTLAEGVGVTPSAIRQHIAQMHGEGLVVSERHVRGRGRPQLYYKLTEAAEPHFPKTYRALALNVLDSVTALHGVAHLSELLGHRRKELVREFTAALSGLPRRRALQALAELQDDRGYMAYIDDCGDVPVLREHNCPFIDVARCFPEFCESERKLYEEVLGHSVKLSSCRTRGDDHCAFVLGGKDQITQVS